MAIDPSPTAAPRELIEHARTLADRAKMASAAVAQARGEHRSHALRQIARDVRERSAEILEANQRDLAGADGLSSAMRDRLTLDEARIEEIAAAVEAVAHQPDPVGEVLDGRTLPNGLRLAKCRVPLGVVCIIFEARPNVLTDAAALCLRSGNACVLRGGKECANTNAVLAACVANGLEDAGLPGDAVVVVDTPDRALIPELLKQVHAIDVVIPRGGEGLIRTVVANSAIPVIKHYTGNCHVYVHASCGESEAGAAMARRICVNAKTQRPGVCNAAETILFDFHSAPVLLPKVCGDLFNKGVEVRGCSRTVELFADAVPATEADWDAEYLDLIVAVRVVADLDAAVRHINTHGSRHTDAIVSTDYAAAEAFVNRVDSANVMINASTRFSDGGEYGLGAEIGISTDKLHARGPMGAADLCTTKWIVRGDGHTRG